MVFNIHLELSQIWEWGTSTHGFKQTLHHVQIY